MIFGYLNIHKWLCPRLGGGGGGTSTTTQQIPKQLRPLARAFSDKAIDVGNDTFHGFGGERFAGFNQNQISGMDQIANRAMNGSPLVDNAQDSLSQNFLQGGSNPYLDQAVQRGMDSVTSNFNTATAGSGSFGNHNLMQQFGNDMGDVASKMYGQAYEGDQNRRLQAIQMAPGLANQDYFDSQQLMNVGNLQQDQSQQQKDFNFQQFMEEQNLPYKQLAAMSGVFSAYPGGSTTTQQSGSNK